MKRYTFIVFVLLFVLSTSLCSQKDSSANPRSSNEIIPPRAKVTYIANEGVLIEASGKKILIDGLHRFYNDAYAYPPDDLRERLESATAPYDNLDLIFVSHLHGDHFHRESVASHLKNSTKAILAASKQIVSEIEKGFAGYDEIKTKISPVTHEWKKSSEEDFGGIKVKFLGLRHGSERFTWIQNLGHLIEVGGKKYLHIGDADMKAENFESFKLNNENIDVLFVPYWFLQSAEGRKLVEDQFKPKNMIAVHVSPGEAESVTRELKSLYPEITVFTKILETKFFD